MRAPSLIVLLALISGTFTDAGAQAQVAAERQRATVVKADEGDKLIFCNSPEISLTIKADSMSVGASRMIMGTGELAPRTSHVATHPGTEEVSYVLRGVGHAVIGTDTLQLRPGTTIYFPEGITHTVSNLGEETMAFIWVMAPRERVESSARKAAVPPGTPCPPPTPR